MAATTEPVPTQTSNPILALLKNKMLTNPQTWKKLQMLLNVLIPFSPVLGAIFPSLKGLLDPAFLTQLYAALGAVNVYLTAATSGKVGL